MSWFHVIGPTIPSAASPTASLEGAHGPVGLRPEDAVDLHALRGVAGQVAELELVLHRAHGGAPAAEPDGDEQLVPGARADDAVDDQAAGALEGRARPRRSARRTRRPRVTEEPRARSRYCRLRTGWPDEPRRSSGHGSVSTADALRAGDGVLRDRAPTAGPPTRCRSGRR